jgi:hypothetical protein
MRVMLNVAIEVSGKDKGQKDYTEETQPVLDAQGAVMPLAAGSSGNLCVNRRPLGERMKTPTVLHGLRNVH